MADVFTVGYQEASVRVLRKIRRVLDQIYEELDRLLQGEMTRFKMENRELIDIYNRINKFLDKYYDIYFKEQ